MKKSVKLLTLVLSCLFCVSLLGAVEVTIDKIPASETEFLALRDRLAATPEGGAAVFLTAMLVFSENQKMGMQFFTIALAKDNLTTGAVYKGFRPGGGAMYHIDRLSDPRRKRIPYFYISGTSIEDGYQAELPYKFNITTNAYSHQANGNIKVFVSCAGGTMPRPMMMQKNDKGLWKTLEFSSFSLDVPMPAGEEAKDNL